MKFASFSFITMLLAINSLIFAQGLKVEPGTCIKVEAGTTLDLSGGGDLLLESSASGDASLIDLGSVTYSGGGEASVERYLTNGKWHLISTPVAGAVAGQFEGDYLQIHAEATDTWSDIVSSAYALLPMKGFALWTVDGAPSTELFNGTTLTGSQTYNFTQNGTGYNLVGNPYPSAIDWDAVSIPAQLNGAIWLFDPTVGTLGDYKYYISGGGLANTTTQFIPSAQGFFVRATGGGGTLTLNNTARTHGGQPFYKATQSEAMVVLKATGNNITTQTAIRFIDESTSLVDRLFDVPRMVSQSPEVPMVYTVCQGEKMAINTLPSVTGHETVPLFFEAGLDGVYNFTATELESLGATLPVFLEDVTLQTVQNLHSYPQYSFDYTAGNVKHFNLHFKDVTGLDEVKQQPQLYRCSLTRGRLTVTFAGNQPFEGSATITVYNLAGQPLLTFQSDEARTEIPFVAAAAVYIVHIRHNQSTFSTKVFNH